MGEDGQFGNAFYINIIRMLFALFFSELRYFICCFRIGRCLPTCTIANKHSFRLSDTHGLVNRCNRLAVNPFGYKACSGAALQARLCLWSSVVEARTVLWEKRHFFGCKSQVCWKEDSQPGRGLYVAMQRGWLKSCARTRKGLESEVISKCHLLRDVESTPRDPLDLSGASLGLSLRLSGLGPRDSRDSHVCSLSRLAGWIVGWSKVWTAPAESCQYWCAWDPKPKLRCPHCALTDLKLQLWWSHDCQLWLRNRPETGVEMALHLGAQPPGDFESFCIIVESWKHSWHFRTKYQVLFFSCFFLPKTKEPEKHTIWTRNGRLSKPYTEMKRACKRKKEQGTHETKTEKIKKEQKRRRVVKSRTGSRRLITYVSVQLFHRPSTPVQQRRAVRNSTAPVLLPRSARVDLFALTVEYMSELEVGMVRFWGSPMCSSTLWGNPWGLPALCAGFILCLCEGIFLKPQAI